MENTAFSLSLATLQEDTRYLGLSFRSYIEGGIYELDPLLAEHCGEQMDYGHLFAYCFRRFGYPNTGWDDYKELTNYYLSTPHPDMIFRVVPYVGGNTDLQLKFMVTESKLREVEDYARRAQKDWTERGVRWMEANCFPDWMEEWRAFCDTNESMREMLGPIPHWKDSIRWMGMDAWGEEGSEEHTLTARAHVFYRKWWSDFAAIEASPPFEFRVADWRSWEDTDPLKALAHAAHLALADLMTPVSVRDLAINAYGEVDPDEGTVAAADSAGYPSGALGNVAPVEFSKLHGLIVELGAGDVKLGIEKACELLAQAIPEKAGEADE